MKSIREAGPHLTWSHPDPLRRDFELRANGEVYGTLTWERDDAGSLATATTTEGSWTFKRLGYLQPHVTIREVASGRTVARFDAQWNGPGVLHLVDGRTVRFEANFWLAEWDWVAASGEHVVKFKRDFSAGRREGHAHLSKTGDEVPNLAVLVLLGWYLLVLMAEDSATVLHRDLADDDRPRH